MDYTRRAFVRTLFIASQATLVGQLFASEPASAPTLPNSLNFLVIGDWGRMGRPDQREVAGQMAITAKGIGSKFVISVGDNFYEKGVTSAEDTQWKKSFETVYDAPSLQTPWYVILGNHDYRGNCDAQVEYGRTHPRWGMPARYFAQAHPINSAVSADFFYVDTSPFIKGYLHEELMRENILSQDVPKQLEWLDAALGASKAQWKIVIGHHPIYSGGLHGNQPELIAQLQPILEKHKVQAYLCGHDHDLQHLKAGELNIIVTGGGSEHRPSSYIPFSKFDDSSSGFVAVSLAPEAMQVRFIDNNGKQLYTAEIPRVAVAKSA